MRSNVIIHVSKSLFQFLWTLIQRIVCCNRKKPNKGHPGWKNDEEEPMLTSVAIDVRFSLLVDIPVENISHVISRHF